MSEHITAEERAAARDGFTVLHTAKGPVPLVPRLLSALEAAEGERDAAREMARTGRAWKKPPCHDDPGTESGETWAEYADSWRQASESNRAKRERAEAERDSLRAALLAAASTFKRIGNVLAQGVTKGEAWDLAHSGCLDAERAAAAPRVAAPSAPQGGAALAALRVARGVLERMVRGRGQSEDGAIAAIDAVLAQETGGGGCGREPNGQPDTISTPPPAAQEAANEGEPGKVPSPHHRPRHAGSAAPSLSERLFCTCPEACPVHATPPAAQADDCTESHPTTYLDEPAAQEGPQEPCERCVLGPGCPCGYVEPAKQDGPRWCKERVPCGEPGHAQCPGASCAKALPCPDHPEPAPPARDASETTPDTWRTDDEHGHSRPAPPAREGFAAADLRAAFAAGVVWLGAWVKGDAPTIASAAERYVGSLRAAEAGARGPASERCCDSGKNRGEPHVCSWDVTPPPPLPTPAPEQASGERFPARVVLGEGVPLWHGFDVSLARAHDDWRPVSLDWGTLGPESPSDRPRYRLVLERIDAAPPPAGEGTREQEAAAPVGTADGEPAPDAGPCPEPSPESPRFTDTREGEGCESESRSSRSSPLRTPSGSSSATRSGPSHADPDTALVLAALDCCSGVEPCAMDTGPFPALAARLREGSVLLCKPGTLVSDVIARRVATELRGKLAAAERATEIERREREIAIDAECDAKERLAAAEDALDRAYRAAGTLPGLQPGRPDDLAACIEESRNRAVEAARAETWEAAAKVVELAWEPGTHAWVQQTVAGRIAAAIRARKEGR